MPMRPRRPTAPVRRSKRTSSLSFTTKAAPQSTSHSHIATVSSELQPIGKLKTYRKTICRRNAANITPSIAAATSSARLRSQAASCRDTASALLQRRNFFKHALRPLLCLVRGEVDLLRVLAERLDVRCVDLQPGLLEALDELRLALQMLVRAPGERLVGRGLEALLVRPAHAIPGLQVHAQEVVADEMRCEDDLRHYFIELHRLHVRQRIVLAVDRAGLQAGVGLGKRHRRRIGAERAAEELPSVARRHA